ncbi:hypothetical protein ACFV29_36585 [Streptomyces sp. NPDC059690]|uniref:hypothetical protein n=1 Tax=Streptomyces sp. NPDC059690 TaxID=3346907 RepID=UPI0036A650BF
MGLRAVYSMRRQLVAAGPLLPAAVAGQAGILLMDGHALNQWSQGAPLTLD